MILWHNGALVEDDTPVVLAADRGLRYGQGVFDTLLVEGGLAQHAAAHLARLARHAAALGIALTLTEEVWQRAVEDLIHANGAQGGRWALNTLVTGGPGPRGLAPPAEPAPTVLITLSPAPAGPPPPIHAVIVRDTLRNERSPLAHIKCTAGYAEALLALAEARARGGNEAILLNTAGLVAEATTANVVAEIGGRRFTPPLADGALDGTTRARLLATGEVAERSLTAEDLRGAERVLLVSSVRGIVPVASLDGRALF